MTTLQIEVVQNSFEAVKPIAEVAADLFYTRLFELDPSLRPMFRSDRTEQGRKLMHMIGVAVKGLSRPEQILPAVEKLGRRHACSRRAQIALCHGRHGASLDPGEGLRGSFHARRAGGLDSGVYAAGGNDAAGRCMRNHSGIGPRASDCRCIPVSNIEATKEGRNDVDGTIIDVRTVQVEPARVDHMQRFELTTCSRLAEGPSGLVRSDILVTGSTPQPITQTWEVSAADVQWTDALYPLAQEAPLVTR